MSLKGTVRHVIKKASRFSAFGREHFTGKRGDKISKKIYEAEAKTGNSAKHKKRISKLEKIQRKDILTGGAVNLGTIGATMYAGKKIREYRERKTVKGKIKKAIGR